MFKLKMRPITQFLTAVLLLIGSVAVAQPMVLNFEVVNQPGQPPYPIGAHVVVRVKVTGLTNMEGYGFPIIYNKNVMQFDSLTDINVPDFYAGSNYNSVPSQGKIAVQWNAPLNSQTGTLNVATVPAGTSMFTLHFTVLANGSSQMTLSTTTSPQIEAVRQNQGAVPVEYQNGSITIATGDGSVPPPSYTGFKIIANNFYLAPGTRGCMPVKVNDFDNIIAFQYVMHWNPAVLEFDCTRNVTIGNTAQNNNIAFSTSQPMGQQIVSWDDPTFAGVTKPDLSNIYEICFKGIGTVGQSSLITIDGVGLPPSTGGAAASNPSGTNLWTPAIPDTAYVGLCQTHAVKFTADKDSFPTENGCIDVKVQNFTNVTDVDFVMTFDNTKLTLTTPISTTSPLGGLTAANFNTTTPGQIRFRWTNANGVNVTNGAAIISPCFTTTQTAGKYDVKFETPACLGTMVHKKNIGGVPYCFENGFFEMVGAPAPIPLGTNPTCTSPNSGSITTTIQSGFTATAYAWTHGQNIQNPAGLAAGTYTVTVTYSTGATATASVTLSAPPAVTVPAPTVVPNNCFGQNTGSVTVNPGGGTPPFSYSWNNSGTAATITNLGAGNYIVTVSDSKQCTATAAATVTGPSQAITLPVQNITQKNPSCAGGTNGEITISGASGGNGAPYTYKWNNNATTAAITGLGAGTYAVTISDSKGCMQPIGNPITLVAPSSISLPTPTVTNVTCFGSNTGRIQLTPSGGTPSQGGTPYTIVWKDALNATVNANALPVGTYSVTVSDQNGCTATMSSVVVPGPATALTVTTNSVTPSGCGNTGAISLSASGGWPGTPTITWTPAVPGNFNPTNIPSGTYTYVVKDAGNCEVTNSVVVPGNPAITAQVQKTDVACFGDATGGIVLTPAGGSGSGYSASWNAPAPSSGLAISGLVAGSYTPTLTDGQGCTMILSTIIVNGPSQPITLQDTTITNQTVGGPGSITLGPIVGGTPFGGGSPAYTYLWSTGQTTTTISRPAGTYTVTITDANNCKLIVALTIGTDNVVDGTTFTPASACSNEGSITVNIPATTVGPYAIAWSGPTPGSTTTATNPYVISGLTAGQYQVTVTHVTTGNSIVSNILSVDQKPIPLYSPFKNDPFADQPSGIITITPVSGTLNFNWTTGATTGTLFSLTAGTYTVTITNPVSGCTVVETFQLVAQWPVLSLTFSETLNPTCIGTATGKLCAKAEGGVFNKPYNYSWSNGLTGTCLNNLTNGVYTVTVTDFNGNTATVSYTLSNQSNLQIDVVNEISLYPGNTQVSSADACDGKATVSFSGQNGAVGIVWSNNVTTAANNTLCGGAYSVTITDAIGCTDVWTGDLTAPAALSIEAKVVSPINCNSACNGVARVTVTGGIEPYEIAWSTGQFDPQVFANSYSEETSLCAGTYAVTITDGNGSSRVRQLVVDEPVLLSIQLSVPSGQPSNFNTCDAQMTATAIGASTGGPITYAWTSLNRVGKFGNTQTAEDLCAGDVIRYTIKDANGCEAIAIDTVPYPADGCLQGRPVMTPNDDNLNDWFEITCITDYENTVEIFNRWGQLVYSVEGYDNANPGKRWNGTSRAGQALAEGVYYFVLNLKDDNGNVSQKKGYVNLLR